MMQSFAPAPAGSAFARTDECERQVRLLLVEDSLRLQELLADPLRRAGYGLDAVGTVAELLGSVAAIQYDLIIVDLGLPDGDGLQAIRSLRGMGHAMPILVITARGSIEDRVSGLDSGADDYLIKPFNHAELLARVRALLRRPTELQGPVLRFGKTELDEAKGEVSCSGTAIELRLSERRLLAVLMRRSGSVVAKSTIGCCRNSAASCRPTPSRSWCRACARR
jgi:DNA-binding response OmpR family regulator